MSPKILLFIVLSAHICAVKSIPLHNSIDISTSKTTEKIEIEITTRESINDPVEQSEINYFDEDDNEMEVNDNSNSSNFRQIKTEEKGGKYLTTTVPSSTIDNRLGENEENENEEVVPLKITCIAVLCSG